MKIRNPIMAVLPLILLSFACDALAHHVLGRPAYSLNEDSNTPPSMQMETQIGGHFVTFMAFPAFPQPNEPGRVNLYATRIDNGDPFQGTVTFKVREDSWFGADQEQLGVQLPDDNVFRQGFQLSEAGNYIVTAQFESGGELNLIDFPLRIGDPPPIGPIGTAVLVLLIVLVGANVAQRKRLLRAKIRAAHPGEA